MLKAKSDFSLILFGASGHLAGLKIFPALYFMALKKRFPAHFSVIGFARTEMDDAGFRAQFAEAVRKNVPAVNEGVLTDLLTHIHYQQGQYDDLAAYKALALKVQTLEEGAKKPVRIAYFSVPPTLFGIVAKNLCAAGVHESASSHKGHFRCIVEKPVGHDGKSAEGIWKALTQCFSAE